METTPRPQARRRARAIRKDSFVAFSSDEANPVAPSQLLVLKDLLAILVQRLAWHSFRIVLSMWQVLSQLDLQVATPLRQFAAIFDFDVAAQLFHFACHGHGHNYYRGWWVSTVVQLAVPLSLVALWYCYKARRFDSKSGSDKAQTTAASLTFFLVFLWCATATGGSSPAPSRPGVLVAQTAE